MKEKERALAHIEKVEWIKPIDGADNIELIGILGWVCISKKGEFKVGDLAVYILRLIVNAMSLTSDLSFLNLNIIR